ncbi:MAG TPA: exo-beta-N-acetylmuramidase NamZ domain-containing protein [Thermoanaerobaculia bacterium]|nr:exo-beta-N-acetylmuramidase NamZ domain-containing protein [Thermoanaerobaculia bacterium]
MLARQTTPCEACDDVRRCERQRSNVRPQPRRTGVTVGELATLSNVKYGDRRRLIVAKAANCRRSQWMDDTGLPWVNPSPNLRSLAALTSWTTPHPGGRDERHSSSRGDTDAEALHALVGTDPTQLLANQFRLSDQG